MPGETSNTIGNGQWLLRGNSLFSEDGSVEFKMQEDGKIAIYWGGECRWQNTAQQRYDVKGLIMQGDGNLVLYTNGGEAIWHSNTASPSGNDTCVATIRNNGQLVVYKGTNIYDVGVTKA
ncbi:hypothetical protein TWF694_005044 [Orbilia ellipsospora]|uniref:Bulb-type lectin domain-containing protein n=1 Tax=Orbilia ellipsospora TaxID=2528407 RepID=A0AAV9WWJ6_9PEZI